MGQDQPEPRGHYYDSGRDAHADKARGHYYKGGDATVSPDEHVGQYTDEELPDGTMHSGTDHTPGHYTDREAPDENEDDEVEGKDT
ncbi:hypothetical protein SA2016_0521 [Sinomonas atrocyanea]|uniref:Uncharacterized protein n=1 Tax=Sinomonas atrocyanea TaxID=37927 RepID=A0A126ZWE7_9MICC|nr:hypothetical protein [Sinomonas atrocyanea]AMM31216.1 hypothetical protein SA2016_0521 [Sinomonas atrocyanea]GEB64120.1 hypothetical protein SAT01_15680 [Sinomonas atrocyanea]GGG70036.1 hypothetical protein GCM10007172_22800 [Sinomonas atrocyanea]